VYDAAGINSNGRIIRTLLADDHSLVRAGIKRVLEEAGNIHVVAEASNGEEATREYDRVNPDVAILDISMPGMDGLEACKQIKKLNPQANILILTVHPEEQYAIRLFKAGATGYVTKGTSTETLHKAVQSVAVGKRFLSEGGVESVLSQLLRVEGCQSPLETISERELQVLCLLARGNKMNKIASELHLSVKTIETYRSRLLSKLHLKNNAELVLFASENGLI
jgi:two-component system, NarL family, invasion response regulator UvrY